MTEKWKHIRPSEYDWDYFKDVNGRETSMVRTLITGDEYIWEASLRPNYVAESHWHPYDIVQIFLVVVIFQTITGRVSNCSAVKVFKYFILFL